MEKLSTSNLLQQLFRTTNIVRFVRLGDSKMSPESLVSHLRRLCEEREVPPERVILRAGIERSYGHQIFRGHRRPSRDKLLQLCFGFGLDYDESQRLLKLARRSELYPKVKRDAVIIHSLRKQLDIDTVQSLLFELELPLLGRDENNG